MTTSTIAVPTQDDYDAYYHQYVSKAPADDFLLAYAAQPAMLQELLGHLPNGGDNRPHAASAWTPKQIVGHLIDIERVFSTRMLSIGVGDPASIAGIDQDLYVAGLDYESVPMQSLLDEFAALRSANVLLAGRMGPDAMARRGMASGRPVSALANLYILAGHVEFHAESIRQRHGRQ